MMEMDVLDRDEDDGDDDGESAAAVIDSLLEAATLAWRTGAFDAAIGFYAQVVELDSGHTQARLAIAEAHRLAGRPQDALAACVALLAVDAGHMGARVEMAEALRLLGRNDEAHAIHDLLLHERPDSPRTWCGLAQLLADEDHDASAEACLRRALALDPGHGPSQAALARLLALNGRHDEAIDQYHDAIAIAPDDPSPQAGMAQSLMALGRFEEAAHRIDRALALDEDSIDAHLARADLSTISGRLERSWSDAERRWLRPGHGRPALPGEPWDGQPAGGAILLLYAEQSLSDAIRMLRFLPLLTQAGTRLVLWVQPGLLPLLAGQDGIDRVLRNDRPLPPGLEADCHASLTDLPRLMGFTQDTIPAAPVLEAPPRRRRPILAPPGTVLKVGLAWTSGDKISGAPFPPLIALAEIPGLVLFALELGRAANAAATLADPSLVTDLAPTIGDYADLAGRIAELDAVVAVDCATAHLAGAMGKPVLLILPVNCHPRWMREVERTPWYPSLRLIRRRPGEDWPSVVTRLAALLGEMTEAKAAAHAALRLRASGSDAAQRVLLDAHLRPGDLLVDCQAGDGGFLPARDDIDILALDPSPSAVAALRQRLGALPAATAALVALGPEGQTVLASARPHGGRRVFALPPGIPGHLHCRSLDAVLADHPGAAARRLVLRLGQTGWEADSLAGLTGRQAAIVVFDHRPGATAADLAAAAGYSLWRFPSALASGELVAFAGQPGTVLALAPGLEPEPRYGPETLPPSPEEIAMAGAEAERLTRDGVALQGQRRLGEAAAAYAQALIRDPFAAGANANKGVLMHMAGRRHAALSCYRRALRRQASPGILGNLATVLRELRRFDEAETITRQALAAAPGNADLLYDLALLRRDQGQLDEAIRLLRQLGSQRPGAAWTLTQTLMAAGDMAGGLALFQSRPTPPPPLPDIPVWQGEELMAETVLAYQDCDLADAILLARFLPQVGSRGGLVTLTCQPELAPLLGDLSGVERVFSGDDPLPICDRQIGLSQLPRLLMDGNPSRLHSNSYLSLPAHIRPRRFIKDTRLHVGLSWGGRMGELACGLGDMLNLAEAPDLSMMALGGPETEEQIRAIGAHVLVETLSPPPVDMAESAGIIASLDVVVGGDTPEIHLAAALGKPCWVLLPHAISWRWPHNRDDSPWYSSVRLFRQSPDGSWTPAINRVAAALKVLAAKKRG